ncbi:MAG: hypothetical protein GXP55_13870 [Deltaproteobacteria bacterium]|nr:hypothetical protein [Deltaproteobacteria bacterium]
MTDTAGSSEDWGCRWEDARRRSLTLGARTTPEQRLQWLEEAMRLALQSGALVRTLKARAGRIGGPWPEEEG